MANPLNSAALSTPSLPIGVSLHPLHERNDGSARITQIYRREWPLEVVPVQWNLVNTGANTLRGVHVHTQHWDYLFVASGEMLLGLHDMRPGSPTYRMSVQRRLQGESPCSIAIPPGIAHGFCFTSATTYFYAMSHYWKPSDELGCRWNDPKLGFTWPTTDPLLSPRDACAPDYEELTRAVADALDRATDRS